MKSTKHLSKRLTGLLAGTALLAMASSVNATILNPGFESGLANWIVGGDAAAASAVGSYQGIDAPFGHRMALISNDPAGVSTTVLRQNFAALTDPVEMLVNFITDETTPSFWNDRFVARGRVNGIWTLLLRLDTRSTFIGTLPNGYEQTGFIPFLVPVGTDRLRLVVRDRRDTIVESVALIDSNTNTVPEPATIALLGLGLAGMGATRRRRTSRAPVA